MEASVAFIDAFMKAVESSMEAWKLPLKQLPWKFFVKASTEVTSTEAFVEVNCIH